MRPASPAEVQPEDRLDMNDEQWRRFQEYTRGYGEQDDAGVDIGLLRSNLKLTPTERVERLRRCLEFDQEVIRAGRAARLRSDY